MSKPALSPWSHSRQRSGERSRKQDAVLRTAARFFNERGYHATSLDDVAEALGVTKPTIYRYFANKDEILFECTRRGLNAIAASARDAAVAGDPAPKRLRAMLLAYARIMLDDFGICVARTQDHLLSPESRAAFRSLKREIDLLIRAVVAEGAAEGSLSTPDPRLAAFTFAGALNGLGAWFDPAGPMTAEEVATRTVDGLMQGVMPGKDVAQ
ncbi:TetR/AcrR family transcriptional regulator [Haematobacter genomosp. 1]|uniref:TetR family transcriptional regulator n=1 Tax=Haematobacter genomosp. 1 TaxID=366618 RepID=A0A212A779_9RHOB|nr:TetR/AcrR family transcriptional regulator [Haematobacter genomosp. 1]OWJ75099.1 TetR family transcriptional regulator [Haematobacter genomosp. 1]